MNKKGFTLVEIMISMLVGGLVAGAIYSSFISQQQNATVQEQIVEMQQNLRAAVDIMSREIRMAGFDDNEKTHLQVTPASVLVAGSDQIVVSMDLNFNSIVVDPDPPPSDSEAGEVIAYRFCDVGGVRLDNIINGIADAGVANFGRNTGGFLDNLGAFTEGPPAIPGGPDYSPIAENIQAVGFAYAFIDPNTNALAFNDTSALGGGNQIQDFGETVIWAVDTTVPADGLWDNLDTNMDGTIDEADLALPLLDPPFGGLVSSAIVGTPVVNPPGSPWLSVLTMPNIRAVRIWILARARNPDPKYTNNMTYVVGRQVIKVNDNFRRRLMEVIVDLRTIKNIDTR